MDINYKFVPEFELRNQYFKGTVLSYAGKLLEICEARSMVVYLDNYDVPQILMTDSRLLDPMDGDLTTY